MAMKNIHRVLVLLVMLPAIYACSHQQSPGSSAGSASAQAAATFTPVPASVRAHEFATFTFTDVAVTTSGPPVLRLGFNVKNGSSDPLLCDESSFSLQLVNGTVLAPDAGAQNTCMPDSIDPGSSAQAVIFFDLPSGYSGPGMLIMKSSDNSVIGQGTTKLD